MWKQKSVDVTVGKSSDRISERQQRGYPWDQLEIGQSFFAPGAILVTMQSNAYNRSRKSGKRFRAVQHADGTVEVGRIA